MAEEKNPRDAGGKVMTAKQIRARARRRGQNLKTLADDEKAVLMKKPIEEWDIEELARGRPRAADGSFSGRPPSWISRDIYEQAMDRFKDMVRTDMRSLTVRAIEVLGEILDDEEVDEKGKPIVSAAEKRQTAQFLIEHLIGKPKQPIEADVSVKLQGILGSIMVQPDEVTGGYKPSASHRVLEGEVVDDDDE